MKRKPNIVWIMADDLGYGDLGCYGQELMRTPHLDRMAQEGIRFTDCYAGAHMCAPSRATFLTGKHEGHSSVREIWFRNGDRAHMRPHESTIAQVLKQAGYATALIGKHHAIGDGMTRHFGFDSYYHVHNGHPALGVHYPLSIVSHEGISDISGNAHIAEGVVESRSPVSRELAFDYIEEYEEWEGGTYMDDLSTNAACEFISNKRKGPFFMYLAFHAPHTKYVSPGIGEYMEKDWDPLSKGYVPMVERLDSHVGLVLDTLGKAGIEDETIVFFTSDNGGVCRDGREGIDRDEWVAFRKRIQPNRDLRKGKHYHFEGGIRVPMVVRWPGKIKAGSVSEVPWYFADALPTLAELGGARDLTPDDLDGKSVLPTLLGSAQPELDKRPMYWEAHKFFGFYQVVRKGEWKLIRWTKRGPRRHPLGDVDPVLPDDQYPMLELYNLVEDHREENNLAGKEHEKLEELLIHLDGVDAHADDPEWELTEEERRVLKESKERL
jgi:arylsulfatase A-like enzyme